MVNNKVIWLVRGWGHP